MTTKALFEITASGPGRAIFAIGGNAWGKGANAAIAVKAWRKNAPSWTMSCEVALIDAPDDAWVSEIDGSIQRHANTSPSTLIERRVVAT